ncbi:DNA-binding response regulator, NarL/FixJ family, contains REC and HTH domains [Amycolatopsis pretoriensis]|uniref:DNA-binding response regulator, NarL/FixJ family, contains REC and HTH domains n=1 Tax=Amycolatopsis pretoriensis TaxID=218821 RepID=A0A1H5QNN9_9PSEU|nr:LuxR C-terminal-related transcriptional regulator [Amycolatopsis pretoriensis]SEF27752.1 DNA-binding response regulator, NarL/FixJ family, contains REC and HTH domains [Amycolatopsis pretoriensis]
MENVSVAVRALDPITVAGLTTILGSDPGVTVTTSREREHVDVVVAAFEEISCQGMDLLRAAAADLGRPIVLAVRNITEADLLVAVECRVMAIVSRGGAADGRLVAAVRAAAAGTADLPPDLMGRLVDHMERLHREVLEPSNLTASSLSSREIDVLRLMADGLDTAEIARTLRYSERTVKNIVYTVTSRLQLRNRAHAVAFAMRAGVI